MIHKTSPTYLSDRVPQIVSERTALNLRNRNDITIPRANTNTFKNSFLLSGLKRWNSLPLEIRNTVENKDFIKQITTINEKKSTVLLW
jgi:hypothetical protein